MSDQITSLSKKGEKVLSFGEILLRICPDMDGHWLKENKLPFYVGGAELNVATALALWNVPSAYLSAVPDNSVTREIIDYLEAKAVDTTPMVFHGERLGLYYLPKGKDLKNAGVIYDRANSAYATLKVGQIDWDAVFEGVTWFHFSAICPAINQDIADVCLEALEAASQRNIVISLDLNYRAKLWKYGKEPIDILPQLARYCTLIMGNVWAANKMLGTGLHEDLKQAEGYAKETLLQQAADTSKEILSLFPACKAVANTFRFDHGKGIRYYTAIYTEDQLTVSEEYVSEEILDKVGSGDCFMAGLIYGFYNHFPVKQTLNFATAAAYDKLYIASDATTSTVADIEKRIIHHD
ncbi:sugar kinase [Pedobacter rhizosphaerae]|uniref:2-dehydro-3-deoxygluconokinase n=1 Tax=Pedobacter rhizosphaerae TaxID=390241 RepID=A0A1H9TA24_9SPHI|nr:sugar kinase [Pedobacter rhizosphaerae]SER94082.1 2-dehydro-3-deoxygluconokinase [Pedobacter rhizosphaerae]